MFAIVKRPVAGRLVAGLAGLTLLSGCAMLMVPNEPGVPDWAMHVRPSGIDYQYPPAQAAARLTWEFTQPYLVENHLAPEQIALLALVDIERGHNVDAALWLAMASYRYHEETMRAIRAGFDGADHLPPNVRRGAYMQLVDEEVKQYRRMSFVDELDVVRERLIGQDATELAMQQQLADLGKAGALDREALHDALSQWQPRTKGATDLPTYLSVAEAFRQRLLHDFQMEQRDGTPGFYLGRTPVAILQKDALLAVRSLFEPAICAGVADGFPQQRPAIIAKLTSARPEERANAAAIMGLAPSEETRALVEARLLVEENPQVKVALAYSLVRHGAPAQLVTLTAALQSCQGGHCTLPAGLTQWLPEKVKAELDQAPLARIVSGTTFNPEARRFATVTLRDIGRARALDAATVEALIVAARGRLPEDRMALWALEAIRDAEVLSRADILARLDDGDTSPAHRQDHLFPGPLLARLSKVATEDDLPLLTRMMTRFGDRPGPEAGLIVEATLRVPGPEADARLINWLSLHPNQGTHIALGLVQRPSVAPAQMERLLARGDARTQMAVKLFRHSPDAESTLRGYLRKGSIQDRVAAAELAGLSFQAGVIADLKTLLTFQDRQSYPDDAVVRHEAMTSLLRIALVSKLRAAAPKDPAPPVTSTN